LRRRDSPRQSARIRSRATSDRSGRVGRQRATSLLRDARTGPVPSQRGGPLSLSLGCRRRRLRRSRRAVDLGARPCGPLRGPDGLVPRSCEPILRTSRSDLPFVRSVPPVVTDRFSARETSFRAAADRLRTTEERLRTAAERFCGACEAFPGASDPLPPDDRSGSHAQRTASSRWKIAPLAPGNASQLRKTSSHASGDRSTRTTDPIRSRSEVDRSRRDPLHSDAKSIRGRAKSFFGATEPLHIDEKPLHTLHRSTLLRAGTAVCARTEPFLARLGRFPARHPREGALASRILPTAPPPHPAVGPRDGASLIDPPAQAPRHGLVEIQIVDCASRIARARDASRVPWRRLRVQPREPLWLRVLPVGRRRGAL
jgi:hypothetical protein